MLVLFMLVDENSNTNFQDGVAAWSRRQESWGKCENTKLCQTRVADPTEGKYGELET